MDQITYIEFVGRPDEVEHLSRNDDVDRATESVINKEELFVDMEKGDSSLETEWVGFKCASRIWINCRLMHSFAGTVSSDLF